MLARFIRHAVVIAIAFLLGACSRQDPAVREQQFIAFGTLISVTLYDVDDTRASRAFTELEQLFNQMHRDWHAWEPGPLVDLNRALATQGTAEVPPAILPLLEPAQRLSRASNGLFDPAIGRLLALWGFHSEDPPQRPPAPDAIAAQVAKHASMADLQLEGTRLHTDNRAVQLDFGGFAKGYAAEYGAEYLRALGIDNAIVAVAGDIHVIGAHGERPWRVGIRHPRAPGVLAATELRDGESISTSGDYERYFEYEKHRYHHLLDPRAGYPAEGVTSVTVIARDGASADAAASALFIAGPNEWTRAARAMGIEQVMLVDAQGVVHMTPAMAERLHIEAEPAPEVRIEALPR
ncbi:MAG TPA: FAD:protein FMN transferase [Gammaproteobacteria bacterium]